MFILGISLFITLLFISGMFLAFYSVERGLKEPQVDISHVSANELADSFLGLLFFVSQKTINKFDDALFLMTAEEKSMFLQKVKGSRYIHQLNIKHLLYFHYDNRFMTQIIHKNLKESNLYNIKEISNFFLKPYDQNPNSWVHYLKDNQIILADYQKLSSFLKETPNQGNFFNKITHKLLKKELIEFVSSKVGHMEVINLSFIQILEQLFDLSEIDQNVIYNMMIKNKNKSKKFHISNFIYDLSNFKDFKYLSGNSQLLIIKEFFFPFSIEDIPSYSLYSFLLSENVLKVLEEISYWQESLDPKDFLKIKNKNFKHIKELHDVLLSYGLNKDLDALTASELNQVEIQYLDGQELTYFFKKYQVFVPKTSSEINKIGQEMNLCIGNMRYEYFIKAKKSFIAFLTNDFGQCKFCIEIENVLGRHQIKEIKGLKNESTNGILIGKVEKFLKN